MKLEPTVMKIMPSPAIGFLAHNISIIEYAGTRALTDRTIIKPTLIGQEGHC
jgi:hypothetical protein